MKRSLIRVIAFLAMMLLCASPVFAITIDTGNNGNNTTNSNGVIPGVTTLELVEKKLCEIPITDPENGDKIGEFTKELTSFDAEKKEAILTLTVKNLMENEDFTKKNLEVFFVLDNSYSMTKTYNNKVKTDYVAEAANDFTHSLLEKFENAKIGLVSFSSVKVAEGAVYGTLNDAKLLSGLTNSETDLNAKIEDYKKDQGTYTNIEAGLAVAEANFSKDENVARYIILLSDGVPNLCLNTEETLKYSGVVAAATTKKLQDLSAKGIHMYSILMGLNEANQKVPGASLPDGADPNTTYGKLAEEIFGTPEKPVVPTVGQFFHIDYENLYDTINESIYADIADVKDTFIKDIVIKDYFPKEILENFNFEYVKTPNIGKVSEKVDYTDNSITWNIELLNAGEIATLSYKLTLKEDYNKEIVDKILPTNSKVDLEYTYENQKKQETETEFSKVRVRYVESSKDETITKKPLPQTGNYMTIFISVVAVIITIFAISRVYFFKKLK
ncbi:MAG: VWA domain-containing protein [Clostridia bacterium]|nr:VWA domain-containing protein [Clostridia bacterium]